MLAVSALVVFMYLLCFCLVFVINRLCNDELSLLHIMIHDHVEKWACPRSAGARLSTRETGYEATLTCDCCGPQLTATISLAIFFSFSRIA